MSKALGLHEAITQLSRLVQELKDGTEREIIISVSGEPAARLVANQTPNKRILGIDRGLFTIASDFDEPDASFDALFYDASLLPEATR